MNISKNLEKLGIEELEKLDNESIRIIAYNITEILTKTFPIFYDEYNNILVKLLNCNMYVARITKPISRVNYIYETNSIYFDEELNLNKVNEQMLHECIHYLQSYINKKGKIEKVGLCNLNDFRINGLGLNEAIVQYMSAKCMGNIIQVVEKYNVRVKTISYNYYPLLTNLVEQLIFFMNEDMFIKAALNLDNTFEDEFLNTFEGNSKKIINSFDVLIDINNSLSEETDPENIKNLQNQLGNSFIETQNLIFKTFFDKTCPRIETIQEIDLYMDKALYYRKIMGTFRNNNYSQDEFYDKYIEKLNHKFSQKLMQVTKSKSRNALSIIKKSGIEKLITKIFSYFSL